MTTKHDFRAQAPLGYLIFELSKLLKRRFEDEARSHGITLPQWRALAHISIFEGITQKALADAVDADPMTISGILDRLEKRGLIERYADPTDSRARLARIRPEGDAVVRSARAVGLRMFEQALEGVSQEEQDFAFAALSKMRANLIGQMAETEEA